MMANVNPNEVSTVGTDIGNTGPMLAAWEPVARQPQDRLPKKNGQPRRKPRRRR